MIVQDVTKYVENRTGHSLNRDEGIHHGNGEQIVKGATVAWMATPDAIRAAGEARHELLIVHESLYYPYDVVIAPDPPADWEDWQVNRQRRSLLEQYDLNLVRIHGSADEICILDLFAKVLGLENEVFSDEQYLKIYEISPTPLRELAKSVKERTGMSGLRIASAGDMDRMVHRVGLPWGGMGLFVNVDYQQRLLEHGCDVFIAGETDNYGFRFAAECGIPMIETSHEISENPGFRRFSSMLSAAFFDVEFQFYENDCVWEIM